MMPLTRSSLLWTTVASLLAVSALLGMGGPHRAQAQTRETTITIDNFFVRDRSELQPGAEAKLQAALEQARKCPSDVTVEFFSHFLSHYFKETDLSPEGTIRYQTLLGLLPREFSGSEFKVKARPDHHTPRRTGRSWGTISENPHQPHVYVRWTPKPDQDKPKLDVVWTPPKGKKVKAGDKITAKLTARDDATEAQTGIARLRVDIGVGGGLVAAPAQYPSPVPLQECERENPVRTYEATYTVPANPPPVVQLRAYARDFAGHETWEDAEFPTGDWYGSFRWKHTCTEGSFSTETHATADLTLDRDGRGNLTGTLTGSAPERKTIGPQCTWVHVTPTTFSAKLVGSYTPERDSFSVQATAGQSSPGRFTISCGMSDSTVDEDTIFNVHEHKFFEDAFRDLRGRPDGIRTSTGERTHSDGGMMCSTNYSLTLRRAQN